MAFATVKLVPGVDVERTPTLAEAAYVDTNLVRFREGLVQKLGGWEKYYELPVSGIPRDLHAWQDQNETGYLASGTTTQLGVVSGGTLNDITPQQETSDFTPDFTTTSSSTTVEIDDPNISTVTTFDSVFFYTPVSVGGLVLSGAFPISLVTGTTTYQIEAASAATSSVSNGGAVPVFDTTSGSAIVSVTLADHDLSVGGTFVAQLPTTVGGITIFGSYQVIAAPSSSTFTISATQQASSTASASMNSGDAQIVYNIALGPSAAGVGYGIGTYGTGSYGLGILSSVQTGDPVTSNSWTLDNWGATLVACQQDGGIYIWSPTDGFTTAQLVETAPAFCRGAFVSGQAPILIAYGASEAKDIGVDQDALLIRNSDFEDYDVWTETLQNQARRYRLPTGSRIVGGLAGPKFDHLWTDTDFWTMSYDGFPLVFTYLPTGAACGLIGQHGATRFRDAIYWMGQSNFFVYAGGGVQVLPCSVWDAVFQDLDIDNAEKVRCGSNTPFNEIWWFYPSLSGGTGENDKYVKFNITEGSWDLGSLGRTAWIDQSVLGNPIASTQGGLIYQHEEGYNDDGNPMMPSFTTGYFYIAEGEVFPFVDQMLPDFKWGTYAGDQDAQLQVTLNVVDYPGQTPQTFGPFTYSQATEYIQLRLRGRQVSMTFSSSDTGSFWRLGRVRFRYSGDGRR